MADDSYIFLEMEKQARTKRKDRSKKGSKLLPIAAENWLLGWTKAAICPATGLCPAALVL